jgi:hypothetical protein
MVKNKKVYYYTIEYLLNCGTDVTKENIKEYPHPINFQ